MCGRRRDLVNLARTRTSLREDVLPERPDRELQSELLRQNYVQFCKLRATDRPKGLDWLRGCRGRPPPVLDQSCGLDCEVLSAFYFELFCRQCMVMFFRSKMQIHYT